MIIKTGHTVFELVKSFDRNTNEPIYPAVFTTKMFVNGSKNTNININIETSDSDDGLYSFSWSSSTYGVHQLYVENMTTDVVYVSEIYETKPDNEVDNNTTVYVGL